MRLKYEPSPALGPAITHVEEQRSQISTPESQPPLMAVKPDLSKLKPQFRGGDHTRGGHRSDTYTPLFS